LALWAAAGAMRPTSTAITSATLRMIDSSLFLLSLT
jgi:hypothetical protein